MESLTPVTLFFLKSDMPKPRVPHISMEAHSQISALVQSLPSSASSSSDFPAVKKTKQVINFLEFQEKSLSLKLCYRWLHFSLFHARARVPGCCWIMDDFLFWPSFLSLSVLLCLSCSESEDSQQLFLALKFYILFIVSSPCPWTFHTLVNLCTISSKEKKHLTRNISNKMQHEFRVLKLYEIEFHCLVWSSLFSLYLHRGMFCICLWEFKFLELLGFFLLSF